MEYLTNTKISIVVPCYNEQDAILIFYKEICKVCKEMEDMISKEEAANKTLNFEFVFVDDGSKDKTLHVIKQLAEQDTRVHYVSFSRNFGKEAALYAGLEKSVGDYVVTMDVDLQDPPSLIPEMYRILLEEDYDCAATRRVTRKGEPPIRSFFARCFYRLINKMSDTEIVDGARDYRFMNRKMVDAVLSLKEYNRFSKGIFSWVGFHTKWLEYENVQRSVGETKWSFWKLFLYSLDGIVGFSTVPLAISSVMGMISCMVAFVMICFIIARTLLFGDPVAGWPSLVCIIVFIGGIQLLCVGILGQYIAKIYLEIKQRPIYIKREER